MEKIQLEFTLAAVNTTKTITAKPFKGSNIEETQESHQWNEEKSDNKSRLYLSTSFYHPDLIGKLEAGKQYRMTIEEIQ